MNYQDLQQALEIFGLGERATLAEIKSRHRQLVKRHHPDGQTAATGRQSASNPADQREIRRVNHAYRLLLAYTGNYSFSFSEEEFYRQNPEEGLQRQFGNDPLWGKFGG